MDVLTATGIVVFVAVIALAAAAFLTARSRIGVLPVPPDMAAASGAGASTAATASTASSASSPWAGLAEQARQYRVFGWILVLLLYLFAVFCLLQGLNALIVVHHWAKWEAAFGSALSAPGEMTLYSRFWLATAGALVVIGYWAQRRLRRRVG
ncbi:MAG: hypothetical protein WAU57_11185 [Xanthobacteraceae bacterium]